MATTDCVIPISGLSADGTATLCGVMTSPSEILLTPVLAQNENGLFAVSTPTTTFLSHLKQSGNGGPHPGVQDKTVKFVQFVLNGPQKPVSPPGNSSPSPQKGKIRIIPEATIRKTPTPPSPVPNTNSNRAPSLVIDESCTICGQHYTDRSAFKAHIKLHLKEKLNIRRNKRKLEEEQEKEKSNDKVPKASEGFSPRREKAHGAKLESKSRDVIMAELAACQPVPPEAISEITSQPNPLIFPPTPASSVCSAPSPAKPAVSLEVLQQENREIREESGLNFNMVMNKMDINYDLSNILDEIEQNLDPLNFEKYNSKATVETPPDSDAENNIKEEKHILLNHPISENDQNQISLPTKDTEEDDKLDLDKLVNEAISSSSIRSSPTPSSQAVVQSPSSIAKVGALPPKALAVLNQLPTKLLGTSDSTGNRFINVVKIERSGGSDDLSNTIINIQCQNSKNNKIIESYRAVDNGKELKLIPNNNESLPPPNPAVSPPSVKNCSSECSVCGKTITTKNMARHMEKHTGKKKFQCDICLASFFQKTHLKNHIALHKAGGLDKSNSSSPSSKGTIPSSPSSPQPLPPPPPPVPQPQNESGNQTPSSSNFRCSICLKTFVQKGHLNRHLKSTHGRKDSTSSINSSSKENNNLECKICHKKCKNKVCLNRHRTKHMVCSHCSSKGQNLFFNSKSALQEHLLKFHPESAVLSVENYTSSSSSSSSSASDDESPVLLDKKDTFLDYSPTAIKDEKLPSDFALFNDASSSGSSSVILGEEEEEEEERIGSSIADISNSDFFDFNQEIKEFYLTDLF